MDNTRNYDSDFCGNIPIHFINSVQPYGALLVIKKDTLEIIQASENINAIFSQPVNQVVNAVITQFISEEASAQITQMLAKSTIEKIPASWKINGKFYFTISHIKDNYFLTEINVTPFNEDEQDTFVNIYRELKYAMAGIEAATSTSEVCRIAADELKRISGFDKVMIYKFDEQWNGHVLAEAMENDMESYLGFTFPASDIPKQARQLYMKNPWRFIPDRTYQAVRLYPVINPAVSGFIDLSDCNVRGVASVHLEYLKNMGVTASMSARIIKDDALWGLIACHHKTPKAVSYEMCSVFELLSNILSAKITSIQNKEKHYSSRLLQDIYTKLIEEIYQEQNLVQTLLFSEANICKLFKASGAAVIHKGNVYTGGSIPGDGFLEDFLLWLHTRNLKKVYATDSLGNGYEQAAEYADTASGMLVIPINTVKDEYVLVFRPEVVKEINWGGNPAERIQFETDEKNYHPRHSFKLWQQHVKGNSKPWTEDEVAIAENLRSFLYEYTTGNTK